jgi:uncharacterized ion transporter superfamily protein YfcC
MTTPQPIQRTTRQRRRSTPQWSVIISVVIQILTWVFGAGVLWQKANDIEKAIVVLQIDVQKMKDAKEKNQYERNSNSSSNFTARRLPEIF